MVTVLQTKLTPPLLAPNLITRTHLVARLDAGRSPGCRLVLVAAPAGYGKTTLVAQWLRQAGCAVAWLSLDEEDNDPVRLLSYLVGALQRIYPSVGQGLEGAMQSLQPAAEEEMLAALVNQVGLAAGVSSAEASALLILDDAHLLTAPFAHRVLAFLLAHLPASLRLVLVTRADPQVPLARLRGRGQLVEVRQSDLRFSPAETAAFLDGALAARLDDPEVAALEARTEGWIAGLQMAAVALGGAPLSQRGGRALTDFIADFWRSPAYIVDYLGEEVLDRQPSHVREFLIRTSILDRLTAPLCAAVVADADSTVSEALHSHQILSELAQRQLFVVPLEESRQWYRYHGLFRDLLRQRLTVRHPGLAPLLHRRASVWYEQAALGPEGALRDAAYMGEAVRHALAAEDVAFLVELLARHAEALLVAGEIGVVLKGVVLLPADALEGHPELRLFRALGHVVAGKLGAASEALAAVALPGAAAGDGQQALSGPLAALQATVAYLRGEETLVIRYAQAALDSLPEGPSVWRGSAAMTLGDAHTLQGDLTAAAEAYGAAIRGSQTASNVFLRLIVETKLADTLVGMGQLRRAVESCKQQQALAARVGVASTARGGSVLVPWGAVLREWNQLYEAQAHLVRAVTLAEAESHVPILAWALPLLIHVHFSRGDWDAAEGVLTRLDQVVQLAQAPVWGVNRLVAWRARLWIARKDEGYFQAAADLLASRGLPVRHGAAGAGVSGYLWEEAYLALVRWFITAGCPETALARLEGLLAAATAGGRRGRVIEMQVLAALAWASAGSDEHALDALDAALAWAEPSGYIQVFVDEGDAMARLLLRVVERGHDPQRSRLTAYAGYLLTRFPIELATSQPAAANVELVEPLSERELEVLHAMATGATNREIAQQLVIAPSTVKKHVSNIIAKLAVANRREAVRRAQSMGLVA